MKVGPVIIHEEECELEGWDDPERGRVQWRTLLSGDRTSSQTMTCGVAEILPGPGAALSVHQHTEAEVYYFLAGQGIVMIGGEDYLVKAGSTVFIPGSMAHGVRNTGEEVLRLFYVFAVDSFEEIVYEFGTEI